MTETTPTHLSPRSKTLWNDLVPRRARSPERLTLLQLALEQLDRADAARADIERDGPTFRTKKTGTIHAHPALAIERQARMTFVRLWKQLDLHWSAELDSGLDGTLPLERRW
ncbi:MAG TPA: P27 family phage terminase small subunit [Stellaceae bacterium]|nr:P27 family phage terminase small subunit [Stellaceae bacterium]